MKELKTIWTRGRLITAWEKGERQYEVTVLDATTMAYSERFSRNFSDPWAAADFATAVAHYFERIPA